MRNFVLPSLIAVTGCIQDRTELDFGSCARDEGNGLPGIGTCIAGPVAIDFLERDGETWVVVANSDPYRNFTGGSVLFVPMAGVDLGKPINHMGNIVGAYAIDTDPFIGGLAQIPNDRLVVTDRFSPDQATAEDLDQILVFDVADPANASWWSEVPEMTVGRDPQAIVADGDHLFVYNLGDPSVSALDTTTRPFLPLAGSDDASISANGISDNTPPAYGFPTPNAGPSTAELAALTVTDESVVPDDEWSMTWVEGTFRLWEPTASGLTRWSTGGLGYTRGGSPVELAPDASGGAFSEVNAPFIGTIDGVLAAYFGDRGDLRVALWDDVAGDWDTSFATFPLMIGRPGTYMGHLSAPAVVQVGDTTALYFEARAESGDAPTIGVATSDGATFQPADVPAVPVPDGFVGVGTPFVRDDALTGTLRMWVSMLDAERHWSIGLTESSDGLRWEPPTEVLRTEADLASPVVTWTSGRYILWASQNVGETTTFVRSESYDGVRWTAPSPALDATSAWNDAEPARLGLQADPVSSWLVASNNQPQNGFLARAGATNIPGAFGYSLRVASGFEIGLEPYGDLASGGVVPGSIANVATDTVLYVTTFDAEAQGHISILTKTADDWTMVGEDVLSGEAEDVSDPVVFEDLGLWHMAFAQRTVEGVTRLRTATSTDGLSWVIDEGDALDTTVGAWDAIAQLPHSVEMTDDGGLRLWYSGSNGSRFRVGSARWNGERFEPEPGTTDAWQLGTGPAGDLDDSGVRDPMFVTDGITDQLWFSAFDGSRWRIAHASRARGATAWTRTTASTGQLLVALNSMDRSFSAGGVFGPVAWTRDGELSMLYAGFDGESLFDRTVSRVGLAAPAPDGRLGVLFPHARPPTPGDRLLYRTRADRSEGVGLIDLSTSVRGFSTSGIGGSAMTVDSERGFLYVASKATNYVTVIDIRDDGSVDTPDNYLAVEAVVSVTTIDGPRGLRDVEVDAAHDRLYVTTISPEAVFVLDRSQIIDDSDADLIATTPVGVLPVSRSLEDANDVNFTGGTPTIGPGDAALSTSGLLFVPNFAEDAVSVFDTNLGVWGTERRTISNIGGNPWLVRLTPDERYAVVALYTGDINDQFVSSAIAIVDADPTSPTAFQVLTWLQNR